jgi:hypothetical protein
LAKGKSLVLLAQFHGNIVEAPQAHEYLALLLLRTHGVLAIHFFWVLTFLLKLNGERLAKKSGLSLSAYITTLLVKELAKENRR